MVKYKELGFVSFEEYKKKFFDILLKTNQTYEYFVDWGKVKAAVKRYNRELSLLNSLTKENDIKASLASLIGQYPNVTGAIPLLIAERAKSGKIDIFEQNSEDIITFDFDSSSINESTIQQIVSFCDKTGIIGLFREVRDLHDYLLGIEVGMDTNTRKNRSGDIFERMCQQKIRSFVKEPYYIKNNDQSFSLYPIVTGGSNKGKTHDMVIYENKEPKLVVECNFYNVSGSKGSSIAESYIEMHKAAKQKNIEFLWATDGNAWHDMKEPLTRSMNEMDWVLNYRMLNLITNILP